LESEASQPQEAGGTQDDPGGKVRQRRGCEAIGNYSGRFKRDLSSRTEYDFCFKGNERFSHLPLDSEAALCQYLRPCISIVLFRAEELEPQK
jgi:hypothetical protein